MGHILTLSALLGLAKVLEACKIHLSWERSCLLLHKLIPRNHNLGRIQAPLGPLWPFLLFTYKLIQKVFMNASHLSLPQKEASRKAGLELSKLSPPILRGRSNSAEFKMVQIKDWNYSLKSILFGALVSKFITIQDRDSDRTDFGMDESALNRPQSCLTTPGRGSFLRTRFFVYFFINGKSKSPLAARAVIVFLMMLWLNNANSQDIELSQYTLASPIQNPAFTGAHTGTRLNLIHRNQWTQVPGQFTGSFASFDIGSATKKSGFGINVNSFNEGQLYLQTQEASALYGYHSKARIKKQEFAFHLGAGLGYIRRSIDWSQAVFSDQLDPALGNTNPTEAPIDGLNNYGSVYSSFGALVEKPFRLPMPYTKSDADGLMRFGYSAQRLLPFRRAFTNTDGIQATTKHSFSAMFMLPLHAFLMSKRDLQYLRPAFRYAFQGPVKTWDFSLTWVKRPVLLGASFRMNKLHPTRIAQDFHQIILFGSYEIKGLGERKRWAAQIGYAYDIPLNKLSLNAGSTHELFLTFYRNTQKRNKRTSMNACEEYMAGGGVVL